MTQCTPTSTLLERIGDETTRRAGRLHDELGLPRSCAERWAHDQRADERRDWQRRGYERIHNSLFTRRFGSE